MITINIFKKTIRFDVTYYYRGGRKMKLLNQLSKINLFQKILNKEELTIYEFNTLITILIQKDIAFAFEFIPATTTTFPIVGLTLPFSPTLSLTFTITLCCN